ncbi:MAG: acetyl-CoA C-acyltransferase, partial [Planctomycetes bacterium]|nr:acetyl-CoA C-acyltransferase [Planctomycetota bacterium]
MSLAPYLLRKARSGYRLGHDTLEDNVIHLISDPYEGCHMGVTAENLAEQFEVSRELQDEYAVRSQERASAAIAAG